MRAFITVSLLLAVACGSQPPTSDFQTILDEAWAFEMEENPLYATSVGVHEYNDRLPSRTLADLERRNEFWKRILERLGKIDRASLAAPDQINYDMFSREVEEALTDYGFKGYLMPLTAEGGFHTSFARLPDNVPLQTVEDYENYIRRLEAFQRYTREHIELLRMAVAEGYTLPKAVMEGYEQTINSHLVEKVEESVFYAPFVNFPSAFSSEVQEKLKVSGTEAITGVVIPAYREFLEFMTGEYLPACRESIAATDLPEGKDYYAFLIRRHTTLDLSADQVHQTGQDEVKRIRSEMEQVIREVGFEGSFGEFLTFLRTDERFYPKTADQLLKQAAWIAKKMDGKLPALFRTLPRLPYTVEPVPAHIAPKYTAGRYVGAPSGSTKPGIYWVNIYALESRPFYALTALTLHEAVPGHHLQNALQDELTGLPNFRRFSGINAFGEGWGLYSEWLGVETGFYADPYDNFGRLTYEMWRACRLVVDTGMHAKGWTRQQAMDFMAENTALSLHEIRTETDRYISWPGQALAYKIGELKIKQLRRRAEEELGSKFDVRDFHDQVLKNGPVPLTVLEKQIDQYVQATKAM